MMRTLNYFLIVTFLCFFFVIQVEAAVKSISTDKARYAPGEPVRFSVEMNDSDIGGSLTISYFHLNTQIESMSMNLTAAPFSWAWQPPTDDYKGYLAEIIFSHNGIARDTVCIAVDVSSNWSKFPRYGFLSKYPLLSRTTIEKTIAKLNRYHINGLQFYDWHYKHHLPLKGTPENPAASWQDIANRTNYFPTVAGYIEAAHAFNMKAMSYNLLYGAYRDAANDGVSTTWRLFKDQNHSQPDYHPLPSSWASDIYLIDPSNADWMTHILDKTQDAFAALNFDGWHIDQLGDRGALYNYNGELVNLPASYSNFIQETKQVFDKPLVMNAVNQFGQMEIAATPVDFLYTEVWSPNDSYSSLVSIIQKNNEWSEGKLSTVLAAYVNKGQSSQSGTFNSPAVLLTDAVIFAAGGAHIELGEHMLGNEYFPNDNLKMTAELETDLVNYYDFLVAYQNLLRDGGTLTADFLQSEGNVPIRNSARKGSVWSFARQFENRTVFHLVNFVNATTMDWRDDEAIQTEPEVLKNFPVSFSTANKVKAVWLASPDDRAGAPAPLSFVQNNDRVTFTIPSLQYWTMIVVEFESASNIDQKFSIQPNLFHLKNVPNPFNPGTTIHFNVQQQTHLKIDIFNVLGRHIATLADDDFGSGDFSIQWSPAPEHAGGVYVLVMQEKSGVLQRHKMLYVK